MRRIKEMILRSDNYYISFTSIKEAWYIAAIREDIIKILRDVVKKHGVELDAKAKEWKHDEIYVIISDPYIRAKVNGNIVVRYQAEPRLFVKGDWLKLLIPFVDESKGQYLESKVAEYKQEKKEIINKLELTDANTWSLSQHKLFFHQYPLAYELGLVDFPSPLKKD